MTPLIDAGRLAAVLVQFPWSFRSGRQGRQRIALIESALLDFPLAFEVRHASWLSGDGRAFLESGERTVCGVDQPVIGESIAPGFFISGAAGTYVRFHGRNYRDWFSDRGRDHRYDYLYERSELEPWVRLIRNAASSASAVNVVMNNHFRGQAPANAFELMARLTGFPHRAPADTRRTFPRLSDVTSPDAPVATLGPLFSGLAQKGNERDDHHQGPDSPDGKDAGSAE